MANDSERTPEVLTIAGKEDGSINRRELRRWQRLRGIEREMPPVSPQCSWEQLTGFQRDVLVAIRELEADDDIPTGQEILDELESTYDTNINHGRLYQNLDSLREDGFIDKVPVDGRTNAYYLTDGTVTLVEEAARKLASACDMDAGS